MLGIAVLAFIVPPVSADLFPASGPVVSGRRRGFVSAVQLRRKMRHSK